MGRVLTILAIGILSCVDKVYIDTGFSKFLLFKTHQYKKLM